MVKESFYVLIARILELLIAFGTNMIVNRVLGPDGRGELAGILVIYELMVIICGLGQDVTLFHYVQKNESNKSIVYYTSLGTVSFLAIMAVAGSVLINFVPWFNLSHLYKESTFWISILIAVSLLNKTLFTLLQIQGPIKYLCFAQVLSSGLYFSLVLLFMWARLGINIIIVLLTIQAVTKTLLLLFYLKPSLYGTKFRMSWELFRSMLKSGLLVYPASIATYCYVKIDQLIVFNKLSADQTGYYSVAVSLAMLLMIIPQSVQTVLYNKIMFANHEDEGKMSLYIAKITFYITFLVGLFMFIISKYIVYLYAGSAYDPSIEQLRILIIGVCLFSMANLLSPFWLKRGYFWFGGLTAVVLLIINLTLNYIYIPIYGISAASWISNITYFLGLLFAVILFSKTSGESVRDLFIPTKSELLVLWRAGCGKKT